MRALGLVLAGIVLVALAGFLLLAWQVDRLGRTDEAAALPSPRKPADVIVVLGARVDPDGRPGSDLTSRTFHAVDLWQAGYAPRLICTGGFKDEPLSAAAVCRQFAVELGVPAGQVWLADGSNNTVEDAAATAVLMGEHGWRTAILVSHPLHLFRARWLFDRAGVEAVTSPTTTDVGRIFLPLRLWYDVREAAAVVITAGGGWGRLPPEWIARLQTWAYGLP